jgi:hypothetical protein
LSTYLDLVNGIRRRLTAIATSAGAADANKIVATSSDGRLDASLMPVGIGTISFGAWQEVTLNSGWSKATDWFDSSASGGSAVARVRRGGDRVELALEVKKSSAIARFDQICTLPSEFRPNRRLFIGEVSGDEIASCVLIRPDGIVVIYQASGLYAFITGEYNRV